LTLRFGGTDDGRTLMTKAPAQPRASGGRPAFPADRAEKRRALLEAVESVADTLRAGADEAEALTTLPQATVEALSASGLWALKLPAELGGAEADPVTQLEVIEAVTYIDTSAGWSVMIGATSIGWPGAFLPDSAITEVFAGGRIPRAAGIGGVTGTAVAVDAGYRLSGRFQFASGAPHAEWLIAGARIEGSDSPEERMFLIPAASATLHDNWRVAGLKGTGSCDFSVQDLFVPAEFTWDRAILARGEPRRGGPIFRLGMPAFTANEHAAFALGGARRALDLLLEQARTKRRGHGVAASMVAERPVVQKWVAEADLRLRAARGLIVDLLEEAWRSACEGRVPDPFLQAKLRAASTYVSDVGVEVATQAFRYGGGGALHETNLLQRYWRDVTAAGQHLAVSDAGYEGYGRLLLGLPPLDPMTANR